MNKIDELFKRLNEEASNLLLGNDNEYWKVKTELTCEIINSYEDTDYTPQSIYELHIPAAICSAIVRMEAKKRNIDLK